MYIRTKDGLVIVYFPELRREKTESVRGLFRKLAWDNLISAIDYNHNYKKRQLKIYYYFGKTSERRPWINSDSE